MLRRWRAVGPASLVRVIVPAVVPTAAAPMTALGARHHRLPSWPAAPPALGMAKPRKALTLSHPGHSYVHENPETYHWPLIR